jgi:hypothetical protein
MLHQPHGALPDSIYIKSNQHVEMPGVPLTIATKAGKKVTERQRKPSKNASEANQGPTKRTKRSS